MIGEMRGGNRKLELIYLFLWPHPDEAVGKFLLSSPPPATAVASSEPRPPVGSMTDSVSSKFFLLVRMNFYYLQPQKSSLQNIFKLYMIFSLIINQTRHRTQNTEKKHKTPNSISQMQLLTLQCLCTLLF